MNFHNEITKLQERVAKLEATLTEAGAPGHDKLPTHLTPAAEGFVDVGAAKPAEESKAGTNVQKGPVAVAEPVAEIVDEAAQGDEDEAQGSGSEKYGAGDWTRTEGAGLTDDTSEKQEPAA